jgi:hypothetical protein
VAETQGLANLTSSLRRLAQRICQMGSAPSRRPHPRIERVARDHPQVRDVFGQGGLEVVCSLFPHVHQSLLTDGESHDSSHVVLATYEIVTSQKDFSVLLNKVPRWESLIVE